MEKKNNSGTLRIVAALFETSFLHCKVASVQSLIDNMIIVTNHKFEITQVDGPKKLDKDGGPWIVSLAIGDTKVLVLFYINTNHYIDRIEVVE